ncbi:MAG: amino acid adenylation domain-containing protein [Symploca sp. SIO1B1]|nr:amino acid adenylation domain-containing protein [Symploca sp. SIO1B1]
MKISRQQLQSLSEAEKRKLLAELIEKKKTSLKILPLSFAQERLWFLDRLFPESPAYNIPSLIKLTGILKIAALEQSLKALVKRHETLRTTFSTQDGQPVQVIAPDGSVTIPVVNLEHLKPDEQEVTVQKQVFLEAQKPFDLSNGPLLRVLLFCLGEQEHILFVNIHHIIFDGWSLGVFNRELGTLYDAYCLNEPSPLAELPIQYADFAVWQREWLQGEVLESQLSYWKQHLADLTPLELPTDRVRPPIQSYQGGVLSVSIPPTLLNQLKVLSREEGVTLYMLLLAAFATLLHRYSNASKLAIGSPIANRDRQELEGLLGFFVNTLAIPIDFSGSPTFRELLQQVRLFTKDAYTHQTLPFEKLVDELQPDRDLSRNPLVQVLFALQNVAIEAVKFNNLTVSPLRYEFEYTRFDLELHLWEDDKIGISSEEKVGGLSGSFFYNTDLFDRETILRMFKHFQTLLESIVVAPDSLIWKLNILPKEEQTWLLGRNKNYSLDQKNGSVHEMFQAMVNRTPDTTALVSGDKQWTYGELNAKANQLAYYLLQKGVKPETAIGIFLDRSVEMVISMLAVLKAGGAYVPIDTTYPPERVSHMLVDSQLHLLLTKTELLNSLPISGLPVCCLDQEQSLINCQSRDNPAVGVRGDNLLYIIYTSGSTGQPKGIAMNHCTLVNLISTQTDSLSGAAKTLQFASPGFDVATQEIFFTLCTGGTLYLIDDQQRRDPSALLEFLLSQKIERLFVPFAFLEQLAIEAGESQRFPVTLREIITAGEQLKITPPIVNFFDNVGQCQLVNQYGPAEAHVVTEIKLEGTASNWPKLPPIGRPIPNNQVYILDSHLQPVPPGVIGELYIEGVALARGYKNRPAQSAEKFIPNPFSTEPGGRLYRTGDRARYQANGNIEFIGRVDRQVKIRGYRIEPGEIEVALNTHPGVKESVVLATEGDTSERLLVAYVVPRTAPTVETELRTHLQHLLPDYMVPSVFVAIAHIPLSPNGKVDHKALPPLDPTLRTPVENFVAPRTEEEQIIAAVWQEVLKLQQVGIHHNFFNLGGNSLLIVQVERKLRSKFEHQLTVTDLFQYPTIYHLANYIVQCQKEKVGIDSSIKNRIRKQKAALSRKAKSGRKK